MTLFKDNNDKGFFPTTTHDICDDPTLIKIFKVNINTRRLIGFVDVSHANNLCNGNPLVFLLLLW